MDALAELKDSFLEECEELLGALEQRLSALAGGSGEADDVNGAFRAIHSIKGGAGAFGFAELVRLSHVFEAALDQLRSGKLALEAAPFALFLRAADAVAALVGAARNGTIIEAPADLVRELDRVRTGEDAAPAAEATPAPEPVRAPDPTPTPADAGGALRIEISPHADLFRRAVDIRHVFAAMENFGVLQVETLTDRLTPLAGLNARECRLGFRLTLRTAVPRQRVIEALELQLDAAEFTLHADAPSSASGQEEAGPPDDLAGSQPVAGTAAAPAFVLAQAANSAAPAPAPAAPSPTALQRQKARMGGSIRVDLDRIDKLMNLVGEIVITQSMLDQRLLSLSVAETMHIADGLQVLSRQTRELQESVMAVRAQPVKNVFQRMPRMVRELSQSLGKQARIVILGEDTEVDKTIIEELSDPLTHMIRNSMDHGVEGPEERVAAGKPPEGTVTLQAEQRSGRIVITVSDDGRGINREKLLAKARSRGLVSPEARLQAEEIDALLFHPGLSTADAVTDVSGRGVGMDVVKQNVEQLGGRIVVASEPGRGTRFTLLLPLTLAVMDGMIIRASGERLVLPIASIRETLQWSETRIERLPSGQEYLRLRDRLSPLVRLGPALGFGPSGDEQVIVMTETDRGDAIGLAVDEIVNQQQVVVKSLEASYGHVPGASAATILGDGLVALIVDVDAIPGLGAMARRAEAAPLQHLQ